MKKKLIALALASTLGTGSVPAHADSVYVTNFMEVKMYLDTAASTISSTISSAVTSTGTAIVNALQALSTQVHADLERQNAFNKSISEAEQNYDKLYKLQEHSAKIEREYGSADPASVDQSMACEQIAIGTNLGTAAQDKRERVAVIANDHLKANVASSDPMEAARRSLNVHSDYFCSTIDVERGRCKSAAPANLQNADLKASNLLAPNESMTYGEKEAIAAKEYIDNLVTSRAPVALAKGAEKTPAGKAYLAAQYNMQRKVDLPAQALREIYASREEKPGLGRQVNMPVENASVMGVIAHYAEKFTNPAWMANFATMTEAGLLREQTKMMAFKVYMDYQSYKQFEIANAIVAIQSLDQIRANGESDLATLRSRANGTSSNNK